LRKFKAAVIIYILYSPFEFNETLLIECSKKCAKGIRHGNYLNFTGDVYNAE